MSKENTPLTEKEELEQNVQEVSEKAEVSEASAELKKQEKKKKRKGLFGKKKAAEPSKPESEMTEEEKKAAEEKKAKAEEAKKKKMKDKPKDAKSSARRLIGYITKQKAWLFVVAILVILSTVVSVCSSLIMKPVYSSIEEVIVRHADPDAAFARIVKYLVVMSIAYII